MLTLCHGSHGYRKCIITNAIDFPLVTSNPAESNNSKFIRFVCLFVSEVCRLLFVNDF